MINLTVSVSYAVLVHFTDQYLLNSHSRGLKFAEIVAQFVGFPNLFSWPQAGLTNRLSGILDSRAGVPLKKLVEFDKIESTNNGGSVTEAGNTSGSRTGSVIENSEDLLE